MTIRQGPAYGRDPGGSRYAPLIQITRDNVAELRVAWTYHTGELATALESIRHEGTTVFCNRDGSKLQPGQFHEILWAAQKKAGLRRIKWHELRHSYASILTMGGTPLRVVQSLLGHSTMKMTERYAHLAPGQSAAFMHLLSETSPPPKISGPRSGPRDSESAPN